MPCPVAAPPLGLSPSEINAVISRLEDMDPEAFAGRNDTELRNELASLDLSTFGLDPTSPGKLSAITTDLLEGLNATQGSPGSAAPAPPGETATTATTTATALGRV